MSTESQATSVNKSGSLYFWTTGEDMTWMARDAVREGRHEAGAQLLVESLGMTWDQAFSVLAGKTKLTGNSKKVEDGGTGGLGLADDSIEDPETADYLRAIQEFYSGRYRDGDQWFRPYAFVTGFSWEDLEKTSDSPGASAGGALSAGATSARGVGFDPHRHRLQEDTTRRAGRHGAHRRLVSGLECPGAVGPRRGRRLGL